MKSSRLIVLILRPFVKPVITVCVMLGASFISMRMLKAEFASLDLAGEAGEGGLLAGLTSRLVGDLDLGALQGGEWSPEQASLLSGGGAMGTTDLEGLLGQASQVRKSASQSGVERSNTVTSVRGGGRGTAAETHAGRAASSGGVDGKRGVVIYSPGAPIDTTLGQGNTITVKKERPQQEGEGKRDEDDADSGSS